MTRRRQVWRFVCVLTAVAVGPFLQPVVQSGPHKLITFLSTAHFACAYALMMFAALWICDLLAWVRTWAANPSTVNQPPPENLILLAIFVLLVGISTGVASWSLSLFAALQSTLH